MKSPSNSVSSRSTTFRTDASVYLSVSNRSRSAACQNTDWSAVNLTSRQNNKRKMETKPRPCHNWDRSSPPRVARWLHRTASKPQKHGCHCSANHPRLLYSLSPRENDGWTKASFTKRPRMKKEKGSGYDSGEFPPRTCLGHPGKDTMYLLKLHTSLRPKMVNYYLS